MNIDRPHQDEDEYREAFETHMKRRVGMVPRHTLTGKYWGFGVQDEWNGWRTAWAYLKKQETKEGGE